MNWIITRNIAEIKATIQIYKSSGLKKALWVCWETIKWKVKNRYL